MTDNSKGKEYATRPVRPLGSIKLNNPDLFGSAAGEDEDPQILNSYYVELPKFERFYKLNQPLSIVSARKGMGKSALISRFEFSLKKGASKTIVIKTTGSELLGLAEVHDKDHMYLENYWKQVICKRIILEIGSQLNFALSDNQISLVETAELEGFKNKNLIGSLITRVIGKIEVLSSQIEIRNSIPKNWDVELRKYQEDYKESDVWLLVDDIDAKYVDDEYFKTLISSFFTAIRSLAFGVKNLNIRATVRTDVWNNLRHFEDLDKCRDYVFEIEWNTDQLRKMLVKRVYSYIQRKHPYSTHAQYNLDKDDLEILGLVFERKMPWGQRKVEPHVPIVVYSNHRPRWMGELCKDAAIKAFERGENRIGINTINHIMQRFGRHRVDDLMKEHNYQFSHLEDLINCFRSGSSSYKYTELIELIQENYVSYIGASNVPDVDSRAYNFPDQLVEFLYKIEFISGMIKSSDHPNASYRYQDDPTLFKTLDNRSNRGHLE